jgi:hypothetical protein
VGDLTCLGQKFYNYTAQETQLWGAPNHTKPQPHPLASFSNFRKAWHNLTSNIDWQAPRGIYWICGKQAYTVLPSSWSGSYVLGSIRSSLFLLPLRQGKNLGVPIYKEKLNRQNRVPYKLAIGRMNKSSASWAEDGSWGSRTPV